MVAIKTQQASKMPPTDPPAQSDFVVILPQNTSAKKTMQAFFEKIFTFFVTGQKTGFSGLLCAGRRCSLHPCLAVSQPILIP